MELAHAWAMWNRVRKQPREEGGQEVELDVSLFADEVDEVEEGTRYPRYPSHERLECLKNRLASKHQAEYSLLSWTKLCRYIRQANITC